MDKINAACQEQGQDIGSQDSKKSKKALKIPKLKPNAISFNPKVDAQEVQ